MQVLEDYNAESIVIRFGCMLRLCQGARNNPKFSSQPLLADGEILPPL